MTIRQIYSKKILQIEVDQIYRYSAVDIEFITNDGKEDVTQLNVEYYISTKKGIVELADLFESLTKEFNTKRNAVISCTVVGSARTYDELLAMGF